jgi:hypothetical protein
MLSLSVLLAISSVLGQTPNQSIAQENHLDRRGIFNHPHSDLDPQVNGTCWPMTYLRSIHSFPNTCGSGQQKSGLLCYPECRQHYHGIGPVCWKNKNAPAKLKKYSYGRGFGSFLTCNKNTTDASDGVCLNKCGETYKPWGPMCWAQCGGKYPFKCGMGCAQSKSKCKISVFDQMQTSTQLTMNLIGLIAYMRGAPLAGIVLVSAPVDLVFQHALKKAMHIEMNDYSGLPDNLITGMIDELVEAATMGDPIGTLI